MMLQIYQFLTALVFVPCQATTAYVDYIKGNMNLIISVPHNGYEKPDYMPTRQLMCENSKPDLEFLVKENFCKIRKEKGSILGDAKTQKIGRTVFDTFVKDTGKTPHLIINNIHRSKMEANRPVEDAVQDNNKKAIEAYTEYHQTIVKAKNSFDGKPGLLIDFHIRRKAQRLAI